MYLRRAQERRFELQVMQEASKIKQAQYMMNKAENQRKTKETDLYKEEKVILKREKEARKLEHLEQEVLKRLRDTHVRQQEAIEQIQEIFKSRGSPSTPAVGMSSEGIMSGDAVQQQRQEVADLN